MHVITMKPKLRQRQQPYPVHCKDCNDTTLTAFVLLGNFSNRISKKLLLGWTYISKLNSSAGIQDQATGRTTNKSGSSLRQGKGTISPCTASRMTRRPTHPSIQLETMTIFGKVFDKVKRAGRETGNLPPSSADSMKQYFQPISPHCVQLNQTQDNQFLSYIPGC